MIAHHPKPERGIHHSMDHISYRYGFFRQAFQLVSVYRSENKDDLQVKIEIGPPEIRSEGVYILKPEGEPFLSIFRYSRGNHICKSLPMLQ
jgi:hypothetical protein